MNAIQSAIAKSKESLEVARELSKKHHYDFAVSRAYYAMFYLAEAALFSKGLTFSSHKAVVAGFSQHFIKTGTLPSELHSSLTKAFSLRLTGDYGDYQAVSKEQCEQVIKEAENFCATLNRYLQTLTKTDK